MTRIKGTHYMVVKMHTSAYTRALVGAFKRWLRALARPSLRPEVTTEGNAGRCALKYLIFYTIYTAHPAGETLRGRQPW